MPDAAASLVVGTAALGLAYGLARPGAPPASVAAPDDATARDVVAAALDLGVATFDTAPAYGAAEDRLGATLGARGRVWTKVGRQEALGPALTAAAEGSLAASLARLRRPRVELLQWHNWTAALADDPHFRACWARLGADDRVGALGASTYGPDDALAAVESGLFRVVQVEWNLLNQGVVARVAPAAARAGVALAVRSVFLQGALTDEGRALPALPALAAGVARARALAAAWGLGATHLALRAALDHPAIAHVLVGVDRAAQVRAAWAVARAPALDPARASALRALDLGGDPAADPRTWAAAAPRPA